MLKPSTLTQKPMGKADIHIHTVFSDGLMTPEALVEFVIAKTDLNVIAVTDHDTITGGLVARAYTQHFKDQFRPFEVIVGSEITSAEGEILALFIERDIPKGLSAAETVARIHEQGGLAVAAHPFAQSSKILPIKGMNGAGWLIETLPFDGVEVRNGTPTEWPTNHFARFQNQRMAKHSETGGSDGHYLPTVGSSYTRFEGTTAEDLRASIIAGTTSAGGHIYNPFHIFGLIYEARMKRLPTRTLPIERARHWPLSAAYEGPLVVETPISEQPTKPALQVKPIWVAEVETQQSEADYRPYEIEPMKSTVE
jgi:hypothetical protein